MAKEKGKEKESKEVAVKKPAEVVSRGEDIDRWFDRLAEDFWRRPFGALPGLFGREGWLAHGLSMRMPSLDLYEEKDDVVVKAELPGMGKEDIEVTVSGDVVTIKGEKKKEQEVKDKDYYRRERSHGSFARSIQLPCDVKGDQIKANFKDGVLEIRCPKSEEAKKKSVSVKID
jgi:HSP20 family protein